VQFIFYDISGLLVAWSPATTEKIIVADHLSSQKKESCFVTLAFMT